ncbi:MAG: Molybdate/tungstate import ATP-binding protein WtpC [Promethearchaeota archaeon]|nr:MAG: Molybdate/tungstate import ATP-binding protein WtpC [Candidatus Lokiarchaeota archaeon]
MLKIKHLQIHLGDFKLKDICLEVDKQEYFIILGPTGAGKTILLETIAGIYTPKKGSILLNGWDVTYVPPKDRKIGIVYQDFMLFPHLTVKENIEFGLKIKKYKNWEINKHIKKVAESLHISHLLDRDPKTLSGGEQQKVSIARAIIMNPEILLLDEPLGSLDPPTREILGKELKKIQRELGIMVLHVSHSYNEAISLGDKVAILNGGKIIQVGNPSEVFGKPNSEFIANFVGTKNVFTGNSQLKNGMYQVSVGENHFEAVTGKEGKIKICVRPEEIFVSNNPINTSGRNNFKGIITEISRSGSVVNLYIDTGLQFIVVITQASLQELNLTVGSEVYIAFKATAVHMI